MTRQVKILALSVKNAQEWLKKTELRLKDEGKACSPRTGDTWDPVAFGTASFQVSECQVGLPVTSGIFARLLVIEFFHLMKGIILGL